MASPACEKKLDYIEQLAISHQKLDCELERVYTIRGAFKALWIAFVRKITGNIRYSV